MLIAELKPCDFAWKFLRYQLRAFSYSEIKDNVLAGGGLTQSIADEEVIDFFQDLFNRFGRGIIQALRGVRPEKQTITSMGDYAKFHRLFLPGYDAFQRRLRRIPVSEVIGFSDVSIEKIASRFKALESKLADLNRAVKLLINFDEWDFATMRVILTQAGKTVYGFFGAF